MMQSPAIAVSYRGYGLDRSFSLVGSPVGKLIPHAKQEASEQEIGHFSAGNDVGKSWLDEHITPGEQSLRVSNSRSGISKLKHYPC